MEDIIQKYKKDKKTKNIIIIFTSLFLAISLNFVLSNTNSWKYTLSNVMQNKVSQAEQKADLYIDKEKNTPNNILNIKSSKSISDVKSISFSIAYNKDNVVIKDKTVNSWELLNIIDNDWYNTIIINFKDPINIKENQNILNIVLEKKDNSKLENINLINSNIIDNQENSYSLSTSWIEL